MRYTIKYNTVLLLLATLSLVGKAQQQTGNSRIERFAQDTVFKHGFVGFSLLDEKTGKYVEELNADKYFIPASNTKLFTTYAALKLLKDSLPGFYIHENKDTLFIKPNADPTFLNEEFKEQRIFDKLLSSNKVLVVEKASSFGITRLGRGWSWQSTGMPERSVMPIYANLIKFLNSEKGLVVTPAYFQSKLKINDNIKGKRVRITRSMDDNIFYANASNSNYLVRPLTRKTDDDIAYRLLQDTLGRLNKKLIIVNTQNRSKDFWKPFYTQKTEDVLKIMMLQSNNFLAEHLLIIAGSQINGKLSDLQAIDFVSKNYLPDLSSKFLWNDGSGLSRSNKATPRAFTDLLVKMKKEFGWDKLTKVIPSGYSGTDGYLADYKDKVYSKGGRLGSDVLSITGYLTSKKGNHYIFSFQANNQEINPTLVRRAFERYLIGIVEND